MENQKKIFNLACKVLDRMSDNLCVDTLIQFNMANDTESIYKYKNDFNELYYVSGSNGTMTSSSVIKYSCRLYKKDKSTSLEDYFRFYETNIRRAVERNVETESIIWYDMFECSNGSYNWYHEIKSVEDLKNMLEMQYHIEDYGYTIEELLKD